MPQKKLDRSELTLPEAILAGCIGTKKCIGHLIETNRAEKKVRRACALGAAALALFPPEIILNKSDTVLTRMLHERFPGLDEHPPKCGTGSLSGKIIDLNDTADWSRAKIAHWLEKYIEKSLLRQVRK